VKAIVYQKYGPPDVLELKEVEEPIPKDNEVLVIVHAASVNAADLYYLRGKAFLVCIVGLLKPMGQILGSDIAGRVDPGRRFSLMVRLVVWVRLRCSLPSTMGLK